MFGGDGFITSKNDVSLSPNAACQLCYFVRQLCFMLFLCHKSYKWWLNCNKQRWAHLWRGKSYIKMVNNSKFNVMWIYVEKISIFPDSIPQTIHHEVKTHIFKSIRQTTSKLLVNRLINVPTNELLNTLYLIHVLNDTSLVCNTGDK